MNTKYIFNSNIQYYIDYIKQDRKLDIIVEPSEPPMITIKKGKHTINQKFGKFLASSSNLSAESIKDLVEEYKEINGDLSQYKVKYQTNFVEVYQTPLYTINSSSKSCMTGERCVEAYDYDERLKVLCVYKNSALVGRTLVRTDKKEYVRLYIDHNIIKPHIMHAIINKENLTCGDLNGIKLQYIEKNYNYVCPYLDGSADHVSIINEEYLEIGYNGDYSATNTNGYLEPTCTCECCGYNIHEDESCYVDDQTLCESCLNESYTYIEGYDYIHNDYVVYCEDDNESHHIEDSDICYIESDNCYHLTDNCCMVDDEWQLLEDCEELVETFNGDEYILKDDAIEIEEDTAHCVAGFYAREQIVDYIYIIENELDNVQDDIFQDNKKLLGDELELLKDLI